MTKRLSVTRNIFNFRITEDYPSYSGKSRRFDDALSVQHDLYGTNENSNFFIVPIRTKT